MLYDVDIEASACVLSSRYARYAMNVWRQAVPRRRTSDAKCPVAQTSPGTRDNKVSTGCRAKSGTGVDSCDRDAQILKIRWSKSVNRLVD